MDVLALVNFESTTSVEFEVKVQLVEQAEVMMDFYDEACEDDDKLMGDVFGDIVVFEINKTFDIDASLLVKRHAGKENELMKVWLCISVLNTASNDLVGWICWPLFKRYKGVPVFSPGIFLTNLY